MVRTAADFFGELPAAILERSGSAAQSRSIWDAKSEVLGRIAEAETHLERLCAERQVTGLRAYSAAAGRDVVFEFAGQGSPVNWRESLACPVTGLNNRCRAAVDLLQRFCGLGPASRIYLSEQVTPIYRWLKAATPSVVGSEFLGTGLDPGSQHGGVRHEDMTRLSFETGRFEAVASFDCLEHIPDYRAALRELSRVLAAGGFALLTVPFTGAEETLVRTSLDARGRATHHCAPEYHGDPAGGGQGILCYYHFGHDLLEELRSAGFAEASVLWFWSGTRANLGGLQAYLLARKPA